MTDSIPLSPPGTMAQLPWSLTGRTPEDHGWPGWAHVHDAPVKALVKAKGPSLFPDEPTYLRDPWGGGPNPTWVTSSVRKGVSELRIYRLADVIWDFGEEDDGTQYRVPLGWSYASFRFQAEERHAYGSHLKEGIPERGLPPLRDLLHPYHQGRVSWQEAEILLRRVWASWVHPRVSEARQKGGPLEDWFPIASKVADCHAEWAATVHGGLPVQDLLRRRLPDAPLSPSTGWFKSLNKQRVLNRNSNQCWARYFRSQAYHSWSSVGNLFGWFDSWVRFHQHPHGLRLWEGRGGGGWRSMSMIYETRDPSREARGPEYFQHLEPLKGKLLFVVSSRMAAAPALPGRARLFLKWTPLED